MLLIWGILIGLLPVTTYAAEGYTVCASEDQTADVGDSVTVQITVESGKAVYNAYDLTVRYDSSRLTLTAVSAPDSNASVSTSGSDVRIIGYGRSKGLSTAGAELTFTTRASGTAAVSIRSAAIDESARAISGDAPAAAIRDDRTLIYIHDTYPVTLGEGLSADSLTASKDADYLFKATDPENYTYAPTAKIDGKSVTVLDNGNGYYKISGDDITGPITIEANRTPKTYEVTITGEDVTGEEKATYNTDYTFKLDREEGYHYTIEVTIDGEKYTGYTLEDNVYTIPGADISGAIEIKVTKAEPSEGIVHVTFAGSGAKDGRGSKKTRGGVEYPFKLNRKKGYTYSVAVYVNGIRISHDYDGDLETYYILAEDVQGDITIVITKIATLEVHEYITLDKQSMYLLVYNGHLKKGQVPRYSGQNMYWSDYYRAYTWLVISDDNEKKIKKLAEEAITTGAGEPAASVNYTGNINLSGRIDKADVQLCHDMYNAEHTLSDMEMFKFLNADINGDRKVNAADAAAIQDLILGN